MGAAIHSGAPKLAEPDAEAVRAGDPAAFSALVEGYSERLYRLAYRMLGRVEEAEDAVQEGFMAAFEHRERFEGKSSAYTWLYRIVTNKALMRLRSRRAGVHSLDEDETLELHFPTEVQPLPVTHELLRKEFDALLRKWLDELPPLTRTVFVLRDLEELPIGEVAAATDQTEWAAKGRLKRARAFLRDRLSEYLQGTM